MALPLFLVVFLFSLFLTLPSCLSHEQAGINFDGIKCSKQEYRPFISYHIHSLFWPTNNNSISSANNLKSAFGEHFGLSEDNDENHCNFEAKDVEPQQTELCFFNTDLEPIGPFLTAQWSVFVPKKYYEESVEFVMQHRGELDIFVHPNSGCSTNDHTSAALWGGNKWELDTSILSS